MVFEGDFRNVLGLFGVEGLEEEVLRGGLRLWRVKSRISKSFREV